MYSFPANIILCIWSNKNSSYKQCIITSDASFLEILFYFVNHLVYLVLIHGISGNLVFEEKVSKVMRRFLEPGSRKVPVPLQPCCNCAYEMSPRLGQMWNECGVVKVRGRSLEECHCVHTHDYIHVCKKSVIFPALIFAICAHAEWHCILTPYAKFHLKERINV